jgi:hypothetical protein
LKRSPLWFSSAAPRLEPHHIGLGGRTTFLTEKAKGFALPKANWRTFPENQAKLPD